MALNILHKSKKPIYPLDKSIKTLFIGGIKQILTKQDI